MPPKCFFSYTRGGQVIFEQTVDSICIEVDIYRGKIEIRIIDRCTKANSEYYCEQVLQPLLKNDVPRQFPDDPEPMVFHRDSGSGHIARETIQFLKNNNVNFTDKEEWMPKPQELP